MPKYVTDPALLEQLNAPDPRPSGSPLDRALAAEGLADHPVFAPLARGVYGQESTSGANARDSNRGAVGGMQVMPKTFMAVADRGWDIRNEDDNARAGVRYLKQGYDQSGGDPKLAAAWYYGGPNGMAKAQQGIPVSDPKNPKAPNTLQYADQVAGRMGAAAGQGGPTAGFSAPGGGQGAPAPAASLVDAANAAAQRIGSGTLFPAPAAPRQRQQPSYVTDPALLAQLEAPDVPAAAPVAGGGGGGVGRAVAALGGPTTALMEVASPGSVKALAGGLGAGAGKTALGLQHWAGKGLQGVGMDKAGQWLVDDAASGRAKIEQEMAPLKASNPFAAGLGNLGGEVLATLPVGGVLGKGAIAAAPMVAKVAPVVGQWLKKFGVALETGGMKTGAPAAPLRSLAGASDLVTRSAGGAAAGGVTAGLAEPGQEGMGAFIGGIAPPAISASLRAGRWGGSVVEDMLRPARAASAAQKRYATQLADTIGAPVDQVLSALDAAQTGPSMIPGYRKTVPQIFQDPALSQLQRTVKNAGGTAVSDAERVQQGQFREALDRIAPSDITINDAAHRAGTAIEDFAGNANADALSTVASLAQAMDPERQTRFLFPRAAMQAAYDRSLGEGTYGMGQRARQALAKADEIGTEVLPGVAPAKQAPPLTAAQAVRKAGGIRGTGGELRDLGQRESGTTGLVNNKSGNASDELAEEMAARGYIDEADPDALIDALRGGLAGGKQRIPFDASDDAMRGMFERGTMGPEGVAAQRVPKPIPLDTMQEYRSTTLEHARKAEAAGDTREAAALNSIVAELDKHLDDLAAGRGSGTGEYFPDEVNQRFREMTGFKRDQIERFQTGPQKFMFTKGPDGRPMLQGAQIPSQYFSGGMKQRENMEAFHRLVGDDPERLAQELKRYALTEGQVMGSNQADELTAKFGKWAGSRKGAIGGLFDDGERATIGEVRKAVIRGIRARREGMAEGSNTAQNLNAMQDLGMLDSRWVDVLANRIPLVKSFSGPLLAGLRETAKKTRNETLSALLANPEEFAKALRAGQVAPDQRLLDAMEVLKPALYRSAPLALTNN